MLAMCTCVQLTIIRPGKALYLKIHSCLMLLKAWRVSLRILDQAWNISFNVNCIYMREFSHILPLKILNKQIKNKYQ